MFTRDVFTYDVQIQRKPLSRRGLLSMTASLFDPLGFVGPVTLIPKLLMQSLCKDGMNWDDPIPDHYSDKFLSWYDSLSSLSDIEIPRCFVSSLKFQPQRSELHIFSDAS